MHFGQTWPILRGRYLVIRENEGRSVVTTVFVKNGECWGE